MFAQKHANKEDKKNPGDEEKFPKPGESYPVNTITITH